eukprot:1195071-Prorocentrum_minimum.AAC.1
MTASTWRYPPHTEMTASRSNGCTRRSTEATQPTKKGIRGHLSSHQSLMGVSLHIASCSTIS